MFLCVFSFFLFLSSQKNSCIFRFTFFKTKTLPEKLHVFCLSAPFSFRVFLSSVFHVVFCLIFLDLLRNMLLYLFISSFCSSSFHLISLFCLLLFSRFFHLLSPSLNFLFGSFRYLHVSWSQTLCATKKSIFLGFCQDLLFSLLFSIKKNFVFFVSFFVVLFQKLCNFSMFGLFFLSWKMISHFEELSFLLLHILNSVSFFYSPFFWCIQKEEPSFCWKMWENFLLFSVSVLLV